MYHVVFVILFCFMVVGDEGNRWEGYMYVEGYGEKSRIMVVSEDGPGDIWWNILFPISIHVI